MIKDTKSLFMGIAVLGSTFCGEAIASASDHALFTSASEPCIHHAIDEHDAPLPNLLSALAVVDTNEFVPQEIPKCMRGTWQEFQEERLASFYSGDLKIINPALFDKNLDWEALSLEDKLGRSAISIMFDQKKAGFLTLGLITAEEAQGSWEDLSTERRALIPKEHLLPSRAGLAQCQAVGCGQFNEGQLRTVIKFILEHDNDVKARKLSQGVGIPYEDALVTVTKMREAGALGTSITLIDHREEPHLHIKGRVAIGYKRSGLAFSAESVSLPMSLYAPGDAYSKGQNNFMVERTEGKLIRSIQKHNVLTLALIGGKEGGLIQSGQNATFAVDEAFSERDLAHKLGIGYGRIPITDHSAMEGEDGDFLRLAYDGQSPNTYVIHHCRGGKGRTQTGMTTRDMMRNYNKGLTLADFILRQHLIGGSNLLVPLAGDPKDDWKSPKAYERAREIANFYAYSHDSAPGVRVMYRDWIKKNRS